MSKHPDHVSDCCMVCMQKRPLDGKHPEYAKKAFAGRVPYLDEIRAGLKISWYNDSSEVQEAVMRVEECARDTGLAGARIRLHSRDSTSTSKSNIQKQQSRWP